jgi:hypothetical protein
MHLESEPFFEKMVYSKSEAIDSHLRSAGGCWYQVQYRHSSKYSIHIIAAIVEYRPS